MTLTTTTEKKVNRADVDRNGRTESKDAMLALRISLGLELSSYDMQVTNAIGDVDCSGSVDSGDAMLILRNSLGFNMSASAWCVD